MTAIQSLTSYADFYLWDETAEGPSQRSAAVTLTRERVNV